MRDCICINNDVLKGALTLNKKYYYIIDYDNLFYPYYIYETDKVMICMTSLEKHHIASVSELFFDKHFIDIKWNRLLKLKKLNEKKL